MNTFNLASIEEKWQNRWEEAKVYERDLSDANDPYYCAVMFPYPSGDRLHIGHWYQYGPPDSYCRYMKMCGKDVFHPMGFDAFGLPAENYAIKTGVHPDLSTRKNVEVMTRQFKRMGTMYDWSAALNTSQPDYYKWTQWLFLKMYEKNMAYKKNGNVNWCPSCQTVLANEQVIDGTCERCGTDVVQKALEQWFWRIKDHAQRLLDGLDSLDWPEKTKTMQRNWIGRNEGVSIKSRVKGLAIEFEVFDSVPQTFMAQTFTVIAPEHPMIHALVQGTEYEEDVSEFVARIAKKKAAKRFNFEEDMEGIFTGRYVENPFGTGDLPIWVASFAVMEYGSGIVHCSAHDERDFAFAKKYNIPLRTVMYPQDAKEAKKVERQEYCYAKDPQAILAAPKEFAGRRWGEVREDIIKHLEKKGIAKPVVQYRLRDWLVSRQRYWGAPIPIVYDPEGHPHPIPPEHLPWLLPTDVEFRPKGQSPLTYSTEFVERTERIFGKGWRPEYDTMDTFVCSSFYYLRYLMTHEKNEQPDIIDRTLEKKWMPVDLYIGGSEHATMHLIYARFVMQALHDWGYVSHSEPFTRLIHQGLITNKGAKMSKSKGNVVSPDEFVDQYGSDVFRMFLMFMGPFTQGGDWSDTGIRGVDRFVRRLYRFFAQNGEQNKQSEDGSEVQRALHRTIKKVTEHIEKMQCNTAIASLMELLNLLEKHAPISQATARSVVLLIAPLAPHLAEELWEMIGGKGFVLEQSWPAYDPKLLLSDTMTIVVQVNGKVRADLQIPAGAEKSAIIQMAKEQENVRKYLHGKEVKKEIYVAGKLVNFVV